MISTIAKKEIITVFRNKSYQVTCLVITLLMLTATIAGYRVYQYQNNERLTAAKEKRDQWLHQDAKHPHIAAHFGNFAFMPKTALSLFDYGLDAFTGTVVYLEPHRQNEFSFKPAEEQSASLRFGELSLAFILQVLFPLIIIFNCFSAFTREKEDGTIKLLYSQGVNFKELFAGKFLGYAALTLFLFLPAILLLLGAQLIIHIVGSVFLRILLLIIFYAVYLLLFMAITLLVSAYSKSSKSAVLFLLGLWIMMVILIPKWAANAGDNLHPLPSRYDFLKALHQDIEHGINGHDPGSSRAQALKRQLLAKYHVDTVSKLPFNFEGYIMQAGEDYSSRVYDKHFTLLQQTLTRQNQISLWCSLIDPFIAIKNISMGLAGTDYYTHLNFQQQAENYRREFVQHMNGNMQYHSHLGDWGYKVDQHEYARIPEFSYHPPGIRTSLRPYLPGFCSMFLGILIVIGLIATYHQKFEV